MVVHGYLPRIDAAIFADTQSEGNQTYAYLQYLEAKLKSVDIPLYRVSAGDLRQDVLASRYHSNMNRLSNPPFYVLNRNGDGTNSGGMLWRKCTRDYKIVPIESRIRQLLGVQKGNRVPRDVFVDQWFGISTDEFQRIRQNKHAWISNKYPLIEKRISRQGCIAWLTRHKHPIPPKSACTFCPYKSNRTWTLMAENNPEEFADMVQFDAELRSGPNIPGVTGQVYLHRRMLPLSEAVLKDTDPRQQNLNLFEEVCDGGFCGV
jgi:hypothetical protein